MIHKANFVIFFIIKDNIYNILNILKNQQMLLINVSNYSIGNRKPQTKKKTNKNRKKKFLFF